MNASYEFRQQGFLSPSPVFNRWQAQRWLRHLQKNYRRPKSGNKSRAAYFPAYLQLAQEPRIVNTVRQLIGDNIILWGASLVRRPPGEYHPWHSDVETAYAGNEKTVSVWIALSNVGSKSGMQFVSSSHLFGASVQELRYRNSVDRSGTDNSLILDWARSYNPNSEICRPDLKVGDAIYFDGRIWHGSINHARSATRVAVLLQYATPDVPIRTCESAYISPCLRTDEPKPPCILISGRDDAGVNSVIPAAAVEHKLARTPRKAFLSCTTRHIDLPLQENPDTGRQSCQLGGGITPTVDYMNFHMTILSPGVMPHEPHSHLDEELLIMLDGEAELVMVPENITAKQVRHKLQAGSLVFYPAFCRHTIHNTGSAAATYLMFKWRAVVPSRLESQAAVYQYDFPELSVQNRHDKPWNSRHVFDFSTRHLKALRSHVSLLQPGAGYAAHRDRYDVAILLLKGRIETLGRTLEPFSTVYYSAGEMHGLRNTGDTPAYYLVIEFHPGPARNRWLRIGLQLRRILRGPLKQIPANLVTFTALRAGFAGTVLRRLSR